MGAALALVADVALAVWGFGEQGIARCKGDRGCSGAVVVGAHGSGGHALSVAEMGDLITWWLGQ